MDCVFIVNTISTGPAQTSGTLMAGMAGMAAGGLQDANAFTGVDFTTPVLEFFERRAAAPNESP